MPRDLLLELSAHNTTNEAPTQVVIATAATPSVATQSFDALRATALELLADDDVASCSLKYLDSDGDLVTLASDRDLQALLQYMNDEQLARVTVMVKANRSVVQRQLRGLVAAVTKFAQQLERKEEKPTVADALKWLEKSVAAWEVAADSAPELATIRDELLQVLADADFCAAMEETSKASEFKELIDAVLDAVFKKDELVANDLLATRFDEIFAFAQRILAACPSLKLVLVRLTKRCAALLVRYNGELLAQQSTADSETVEMISVDADASEADVDETTPVLLVCYACHASPIVGVIYRSEEDPQIQLCGLCFSTGDHHDDSDAFVAMNDAQRVLHPGVMCDGCDMYPIAGVRYKALNDKDFDLCEACEASGQYASHEPFVKITDPSRAPKKLREQEASTLVHPFVTCDGCEMSPLVGKRFKSTVVRNFDLCESCHATGAWHATHAPFATIEAGDFRGKKAWFKFSGGKFKKHCGPHGRHGHEGHHDGQHPHPHPPHQHHHHGPRHGHHHGHGPAMTFFGGWRENMQLQARFVEDMTIPDGCVVSPSASLRKSWKLENSGETAWPLGCRLEIQAGNPTFGIQAESNQVGLPGLQPGEYAVADVDVRAPAAPGRYTTYWRVCDPSGTQFGHRFWIDIVVAGSDEEMISACGVDAGIATGSDEAPSNNVDLTEATGSDDDSDNSSESGSDSSSESASSVDDASEKSADEDEDSVADDDDDDDVEIVSVRAVETEETDQYRDALSMLASMGFADAEKNRRHLEIAEGNVTDAVVSLLTE